MSLLPTNWVIFARSMAHVFDQTYALSFAATVGSESNEKTFACCPRSDFGESQTHNQWQLHLHNWQPPHFTAKSCISAERSAASSSIADNYFEMTCYCMCALCLQSSIISHKLGFLRFQQLLQVHQYPGHLFSLFLLANLMLCPLLLSLLTEWYIQFLPFARRY